MLSRLRWTRRPRWLLGAIALLALTAGVAIVYLSSQEGDVFDPRVPFRAEKPPAAPRISQSRSGRDAEFKWPVYGYSKRRTAYLPLRRDLLPPYRQRWAVRGSVLLEFPPAIGRRSLYLLKNNGALYAIGRRHGTVLWKRKLGSLAASAPAYAHNSLYAAILKRFRGAKGGRIVKLAAGTGRTRWSRKLPSRTESSPLIHRGTVYVGSEDGTVYALDAKDGSIRWRHRAGGAVKGGIALGKRGLLYFGDYGGNVVCLRASNGRRVWRRGTKRGRLALRSGNFYATPAVAYGRVYIGSTNGSVYSFSAADGSLAWRRRTGNYVYASPAVAQVPGGHPTVYVGSYDGKLYALDARTGRTRWSRRAEGRISGGAVVIGRLVWYSTLSKTTTAVSARTGRRIYFTRRGAFHSAVSDGRRVYLVGYSSLFGLEPRRSDSAGRKSKRNRGARRGSRAREGPRAKAKRRATARRRAAAKRRAAAQRRAQARARARRRARRGRGSICRHRHRNHRHHNCSDHRRPRRRSR